MKRFLQRWNGSPPANISLQRHSISPFSIYFCVISTPAFGMSLLLRDWNCLQCPIGSADRRAAVRWAFLPVRISMIRKMNGQECPSYVITFFLFTLSHRPERLNYLKQASGAPQLLTGKWVAAHKPARHQELVSSYCSGDRIVRTGQADLRRTRSATLPSMT